MTCEDVGDAEGVPAVRVGYWRTAALAAVLEAAFEAEEPILMYILLIVRMFYGDSVVETKVADVVVAAFVMRRIFRAILVV